MFRTTKQNVSLHAKNIFEDGELSPDSVVKESLTTAADGKNYRTQHYHLELILAIGYRIRSPRGVQFRQWATRHLKEILSKGFVMDDERLKNPGGWDYFDELLARIREIRASEKRFYQKVRDLFALSSDYRITEKETQLFFAEVQNKLLFAATGHRCRLDRKTRRSAKPEYVAHELERFLVPLQVIDEAVQRIRDGSITSTIYDPQSARLISGEGNVSTEPGEQELSDDDLIRDFFKLAPLHDEGNSSNSPSEIASSSQRLFHSAEVGLFVCQISWNGPYEPVEQWVKVAEFPANPDPALVQKNILRVLKQETYFKSCDICGKTNPAGWMDDDTCHSCMEKNGAVF